MLAVRSRVIERLYGNIRGWGWGVCACMCVYACVKCFRGECGRVVGKLSHHLFIQSTEEGVSGEGGGCLLYTARGILQVKSCFSSYQHNSLSESVKPVNQHNMLDWISCSNDMLYQRLSHERRNSVVPLAASW